MQMVTWGGGQGVMGGPKAGCKEAASAWVIQVFSSTYSLSYILMAYERFYTSVILYNENH